jgi:hypothetical protein
VGVCWVVRAAGVVLFVIMHAFPDDADGVVGPAAGIDEFLAAMRFEPDKNLALAAGPEILAAEDDAAAMTFENEGAAEDARLPATGALNTLADLVAEVIGLTGVDLGRMKDNIGLDRCTRLANRRIIISIWLPMSGKGISPSG